MGSQLFYSGDAFSRVGLLDLLSPAERSTTVPDLTFVILYVLPFDMVALFARIEGKAEAKTKGRASKKRRQRVKIMIGKNKAAGRATRWHEVVRA